MASTAASRPPTVVTSPTNEPSDWLIDWLTDWLAALFVWLLGRCSSSYHTLRGVPVLLGQGLSRALFRSPRLSVSSRWQQRYEWHQPQNSVHITVSASATPLPLLLFFVAASGSSFGAEQIHANPSSTRISHWNTHVQMRLQWRLALQRRATTAAPPLLSADNGMLMIDGMNRQAAAATAATASVSPSYS